MYIHAPMPTQARFMILAGSDEELNQKIRPDYMMIQAIYYGGIAAFVGKTFFNLNGYYGALYGACRGAIDQHMGQLAFDQVIGGKDKFKEQTDGVKALSVLTDSIISMVIVGGILKFGEVTYNKAASFSKDRLPTISNRLSIWSALAIEASFIGSGLTLFRISEKSNG